MKGNKNKEKTIYDRSLSGIFFWSGITVFVIMLIACMFIGGLVFFYRRSDPEGIKIILFCLALTLPCSYGIPLISLFKVWKQERRLGIYWKDRTDCNRPEWERDWYLDCDRAGFILCHRAYIRHVIGSRVDTEIAEHARGEVHCVLYEDIDGKIHTLKFSDDSLARKFQRWFEKQAYVESDKTDNFKGGEEVK